VIAFIFFAHITPAIKYLKVVIPAKAGIQKNTGCPRLTTCRGRLIKSGMTEFGYLVAGLIIHLFYN
jgi:hypothetical protein